MMRVKLGIDPTAPDLHLGHAVVLKKLRQLQDQGHEAVFIVGDFTAMIGDPSGREGAREPLTREQIKQNTRKFLKQAGKILDIKKTEVHYNSRWFRKMKLGDWLAIMGNFTFQQITQREDFEKRLSANLPVALPEVIYPVLQAYDSVMVKADLEIGGVDQTLNLMAGRDLMKKIGLKPQEILTLPLLLGTDGSRKMSKSYGNYIGLTEEPKEIFGKIMSLPDQLMPQYFELLTDVPMPTPTPSRVGAPTSPDGSVGGASEKEAKMLLAKLIVGWLHGEKKASRAERYFIRVFSKKQKPEQMPELRIMNHELGIMDLLLQAGVKSKSEARRLITQGGVKINDEKKNDPEEILNLQPGAVLQIGKRHFFRIA